MKDSKNAVLKDTFISICQRIFKDFDLKKFEEDYDIISKFEMSSDDEIVKKSIYINRWYNSLKKNTPDYSLYADSMYLAASLISYLKWTKSSLKIVEKNINLFKLKNKNKIVDYGCGCGYSTVHIKELFQNQNVIGTNYSPSLQFEFNKTLEKSGNVKFITDFKDLGKISIAFCFEYFEHFLNPFEHLKEIIKYNSPDYFVVANSFGTIAVGHFNNYKHNDFEQLLNSKTTSKQFNNILKENDYIKYKGAWWNNRPTIYIKKGLL